MPRKGAASSGKQAAQVCRYPGPILIAQRSQRAQHQTGLSKTRRREVVDRPIQGPCRLPGRGDHRQQEVTATSEIAERILIRLAVPLGQVGLHSL